MMLLQSAARRRLWPIVPTCALHSFSLLSFHIQSLILIQHLCIVCLLAFRSTALALVSWFPEKSEG